MSSTDHPLSRTRIDVVQGDATEVRGLDALVVPANKQLTLGWGSHLAELLLREAGPEVEDEALAQHPDGVELGAAVLTSAGNLEGFTHLVHAAVLDKYDFDPLFLFRLAERTSRATLRRAVLQSLARAEEASLVGLVLTPMGAGIGGMPDEACARVILEALAEHLEAHPGTRLERVVLACLEPRTARVFQEELARHLPGSSTSSSGVYTEPPRVSSLP